MSNIFFTSDLHIQHRKIVEYTNRGVDTTAEEHSEWIVDLWNRTVGKNDTIYHLGDFVFNCRKQDVFNHWTDQLNGNIILIRGNHDSREVYDNSRFTWYDLKKISVTHAGKKETIVMCHYPLAVWEASHRGTLMLHGHSHGSYHGQGKILDVGLDSAYNIYGEHKFFSLEDVVEYMSKREIVNLDHHTDRNVQ